MNLRSAHSQLSLALSLALAASLFFFAEDAIAYYMLRKGLAPESLRTTSTAEQVSGQAAPFQENTRASNGLFRIVQQQHAELQEKASLLRSTHEAMLSLAWSNTVYFGALSLLLALGKILQHRIRPSP